MSDLAFLAFIFLLVVFCSGDPDLIDAMIHYLMECK